MNSFIIATAIGGVMEKPEYSFSNIRRVEAASKKEAIEKYKEVFAEDYWNVIELTPERIPLLENKNDLKRYTISVFSNEVLELQKKAKEKYLSDKASSDWELNTFGSIL